MHISNVLHYPKRFKVGTISHQVDIEFYQKLFEHFGLMSVGMCMSMSSHIYTHTQTYIRPYCRRQGGFDLCIYVCVCASVLMQVSVHVFVPVSV